MQHPDEGTIHAWLDGELPPDERARIEAHVADCAACADAVAEARGLMAASSRILTALDDVPALRPMPGSAPASAPATTPRRLTRRFLPERIAAVIALVVASGVFATSISRRPAATMADRTAAGEQATLEIAAADSPEAAPPSASRIGDTVEAPVVARRAVPQAIVTSTVRAPTIDTLRATTLAQANRLDERDFANASREAAPAAVETREAAARREAESRGVAGGVAKPVTDAVANALGRRSVAAESRYTESKSLAEVGAAPSIRLVQQDTMEDASGRVQRRIYLVDGLLVTLDERTLVSQQESARPVAPAAAPARPDSQRAAATATSTIRWTDARGVEWTLTGAASTEQLERVKARLGY